MKRTAPRGLVDHQPADVSRKAVLVADVAESVRLIHLDEHGVVRRWIAFTAALRAGALDVFGGRVVKSLGDGVLAVFPDAPKAARAAKRIHSLLTPFNRGVEPARRLALRIGIHVAEIIESDFDVYGSGVNLAARIATLARPGQTILSLEARDELLPGIDPDTEDLGECFLKHLPDPVRAYRLRQHREDPEWHSAPGASDVRPGIAVAPFAEDPGAATCSPMGSVLANELALELSHAQGVSVMAPLSAMRVGQRIEELHTLDVANYLVRGRIQCPAAGELQIFLQLVEAGSGRTLWEHQQRTALAEALHDRDAHCADWARCILRAICCTEIAHARAAPILPNLPSYSVYLSAIVHMHRLTHHTFGQACRALDHLIDRHPGAADLHAWRAKSYLLEILQRWALAPDRAASRAHDHIRRALELEPGHAMATALRGHLQLLTGEDPTEVADGLQRLTAAAPNESLGWLFLANALTATSGRSADAPAACERALILSPLDPLRYFFDAFAAAAYGAAGRHDRSLFHAQRSVRANAAHLAGLIQLILAASRAGKAALARRTARQYLRMRPDATVRRYVELHAAMAPQSIDEEARALRAAGIPA